MGKPEENRTSGSEEDASMFLMGKPEENRTSGSEEDCSCVLMGKPEENTSQGRILCRWEASTACYGE
jgi:hypothetical protein